MARNFLASIVGLCAAAGLAFGQAASLGKPLTWGPPGSAAEPAPTVSTSAQPPTPPPVPPPPTYSPVAPAGPPDPILGQAGPPPAGGAFPAPIFGGGATRSHGDAPCFWVSGEYLLWWVRSTPLPVPLVTTGDVNAPVPGALGDPTTRVVIGDQNISYGPFSGFRLSTGGWLRGGCFGGEASGFFLGRQSKTISAFSDATGTPFLAVPVFSVFPLVGEAALPLSVVGVPTAASVNTTLRLWGMEFNGLYNICRTERYHLDALLGFRYLDLSEDLNFYAAADVTDFPALLGFAGLPDFPAVASFTDTFRTRNQFYGGQGGVKAGVRFGRFTADTVMKVALGMVHESLDISGARSVSAGGFLIQAPGGVFTQPTNIGRYTRDTFAAVPEVQLFLGFEVTKCVNVFVGYNFLYLSNALRPGEQIDRGLNLTQLFAVGPIAGPARPAPFFHDSDFWAQGLNFGVLFHY